MMTNSTHIMITNILIALMIISAFVILLAGFITRFLDTKPKSNKTRQWWSRHICDLDDIYS